MNYGSYLDKNWTMSINRIDNNKNYSKDNIELVCLEFDTTDTTSIAIHKNEGSGGWTKEKFKKIMNQ
jgi:hypothetical protein